MLAYTERLTASGSSPIPGDTTAAHHVRPPRLPLIDSLVFEH